MEDGIHYTVGVFQQSDRWWISPQDLSISTRSVWQAVRNAGPLGDIVQRAWNVQHWAPSDHYDPNSRESLNYSKRLSRLPQVLSNPNYYSEGNF